MVPIVNPHPKVNELFSTRYLAEQANQQKIPDEMGLLRELSNLQVAIYGLDECFELEWNLLPKDLISSWNSILSCLEQIVGSGAFLEDLVSDIRRYQRLEEAIRGSHFSPPSDLWELYRLKSCDVRLARNLISDRALFRQPANLGYLEAFDLFDLAAEACDDLNDLDEDAQTYNGNWFLITVGRTGVHKAISKYEGFEALLSRRVDLCRARLSSRDAAVAPLMLATQSLERLRELLSLRRANTDLVSRVYAESALAGTFTAPGRSEAFEVEMGTRSRAGIIRRGSEHQSMAGEFRFGTE
jgi:hypothetical protein